jgi:suppressor of ftsI
MILRRRQADAVNDRPPRRRRLRRGRPLAGGSVAFVAVLTGVLLLLLGGSASQASKSVSNSASNSASKSATNPHCDARFPKLIKDGFPEPRMVFSRNGVLNTNLTATTYTIHVNHHTYMGMEYDGSSPGPTLVICRGDQVQVKLQNNAPIPTNLHVHGLHVSPSGDSDNIFDTIEPHTGFTYRYQIPLDQSPGSFWYHPHYHPLVDAETTAGMLGAIVVEGGLDNVLPNIPQRMIVIHGGKPVPPNGKPLPIPGTPPGFEPPAPFAPGPAELLVNGVYQPTLHIQPGQLQRWRIWNATGERFVKLALPGVTFEELAFDGETLSYMRPQKQILLGPGERVEVLVRGERAGHYNLNSLRFQPCFKGCFDPFGGVPATGRDFGFHVLIHVVSSGPRMHEQIPTTQRLSHPYDLRHAHVDVYRTIVMARAPAAAGTPTFPLNGKLFDPNRVDITMKLGSVEQWTITSPSTSVNSEWHNFHIHTNPFQVIAINGHKLKYILWMDTVNIPAGGSVVIRMQPTDFVGKAVFHCHVSFHEDNGMMGVFQILKNPPASQVNADRVVYMMPPGGATKSISKSNLFAEAISGAGSKWKQLLLYCHLGLDV